MRRLRSLVFAAALLAVALVPGVAPGQDALGPQIEDVPAEITELLEDYGRAWVDKDESLLRSTLDGELAEPERLGLLNAAEVPFASYGFEATTQFSGDLASPRIRSRYEADEVQTYHVLVRSRIGPERQDYLEDAAFTFTRSEGRSGYGGWRLAAKDDLAVLGFFSPHNLWDEAEVAIVSSERFVLLTRPEAAEEMRSVLDVAERAYERVREFWPRPVGESYVIIAPPTTGELSRIMQAPIDLAKFVAFVASTADRSDGWKPGGPRLFIHVPHLRNYGPQAQLDILAHELVHAVTRSVSGPHVPIWVEEGLANLGGGRGGRPSLASAGAPPDTFPSDDVFQAGPVRGIQIAYDQAEVAIEVLRSRLGIEAVARFYEELGSARVVPGTFRYHVIRAAEGVGWSEEEWVAAWHERIRSG